MSGATPSRHLAADDNQATPMLSGRLTAYRAAGAAIGASLRSGAGMGLGHRVTGALLRFRSFAHGRR